MKPASSPTFLIHVGVAAIVAAVTACGGGAKQEPATLPPQTVAQVAPEIEPPPPLPPPIREVEPTRRAEVKVIDAGGGGDGQPMTLIEASRLAKARKGEAPPPMIEITDENLSELAAGGQVILMESPAASPPPGLDAAAADGAEGAADDEVYWRDRGLELRRQWRNAIDDIGALELEAAAQRQRFYAEDDPYVRDAQIKPAWDRALDRISELEDDAFQYQDALVTFMQSGREAGVPASWLTEGWELEPTDAELQDLERDIPTQDPIDTPVVDDPVQDISGGDRGR